MNANNPFKNHPAPVVIGGVGGSGTRLVAQCLEELDYFIGHDLNEAKDNLWFTLLFKYIEIMKSSDDEFSSLLSIFYQTMLDAKPLSDKQRSTIMKLVRDDRNQRIDFLAKRANSLFLEHQKLPTNKRWGWKEPNTHIVLDRLLHFIPDMKYIHVVRNGMDMAHSNNQYQQLLWGRHFVGADFEVTPYFSLKYWSVVHQRLIHIAKPLGENFLLLNFDEFCNNPDTEIPKLIKFLGFTADNDTQQHLASLIKIPSSIGRYKDFGTEIFDQNDVAYVRKLGFSTE